MLATPVQGVCVQLSGERGAGGDHAKDHLLVQAGESTAGGRFGLRVSLQSLLGIQPENSVNA